MKDSLTNEVIIIVPFEAKGQAQKVGNLLLKKGLVFVYRIQEDIYQAWSETDKDKDIGEAEIVVLRLRAPRTNIDKIHQSIKGLHPWPVFCFEVFELIQGSNRFC